MGSLPFLQSRKREFASRSVTPEGAVTISVVIILDRTVDGSWNWMSREVTIPRSLPPREPVSMGGVSMHSLITSVKG